MRRREMGSRFRGNDETMGVGVDDEIETLVVRVRGDGQGLMRDVDAMRAAMEGPLASGAERAGRRIEQGLMRAARSGKIGFEDLRRMALGVLDEIAAGAMRSAVGGAGGGAGGGALGGLLGLGTSLLTSALGLPGRQTGGPVVQGRGYLVGERGPEVFVPTASGQVTPIVGGGGVRDVRVSIAVNGRGGEGEARLLARSARQVARAVKGALQG